MKSESIYAGKALPIIAGTVITVFWIAMMGSLVKNYMLPQASPFSDPSTSLDSSKLTTNWKDYEEFMTVNMAGKRAGASVIALKQLPGKDAGFRADFRFAAILNFLGISNEIRLNAAAELDSQFGLSAFGIEANFLPLHLRINGLCTESEMLVETLRGNDRILSRFAIPRKISLLDAVRPAAIRKLDLKPGYSMTIPVVDPVWSMQQGMLRITVRDLEKIKIGELDVDAFRIETKLNDFVSTTWVDSEGATLRRQIVGALTMDRSTEREVRANWPGMRGKMEIPRLEPRDFASLPLQQLKRMSDEKNSPLTILGSLPR